MAGKGRSQNEIIGNRYGSWILPALLAGALAGGGVWYLLIGKKAETIPEGKDTDAQYRMEFVNDS